MNVVGFDSETIKGEPYSFQFYSNELKLNHFITDFNDVINLFESIPNKSHFFSFFLEFDVTQLRKVVPCDWRILLFYNQSSLIKGKLLIDGNKVLYFHDVFALFPRMSLRKVGEIVGLQKLEKPTYLGEREPKSEEELEYFKRYALRDAELCYFAVRRVLDEVGMIRSTVGSLSKAVFHKRYYTKQYYPKIDNDLEVKLREAYKGGRVEVFQRGSCFETLKHYDFNSLYSSVMHDYKFPIVKNIMKKRGSCNLCRYGIAFVDVFVDHDIPPLGIKVKCYDRIERLVFPEGHFSGWFTYPELRMLEESGCGKIEAIHEAYEVRYGDYVFRDFVRDFYELKEEAMMKKDASKYIYKLILNSLYGKFAELGEGKWYEVLPTLKTVKLEVGNNGKDLRKNNIFWAAYISAYGRMRLWEVLNRCGLDHIYYSDTDSVITDRALETSTELGKLKLHSESKDSMFIRSKFYVFGDTIKMKGFFIPFKADDLRKCFVTRQFEIPQKLHLRLREAYRRHNIPFKDMEFPKRFNPYPDGKRIYQEHKLDDILFNCFSSKPLKCGLYDRGY